MIDPSVGVLWLLALGTIWYGAVRSHQFWADPEETEIKEVSFVQSNKVLLLPILGSVVLILLFFLLDFSITVYILFGIISIIVFSSQFFVFAPLFDYIFEKFCKDPIGFKLPKVGFVPISAIAIFIWCGGIIALWIGTRHWIVIDAIAVCLAVTQLTMLRLPSFKIATMLLVPFLIYDVFWVFISPLFFHGTSVMVSVAQRMPPLPLLLKVPRLTDPDYYAMLGLGDIALPGLFMVFLYAVDRQFDREEKITFSNLKDSYLSYFTCSLIEYSLGYIVTIIVLTIMQSGQPALLYLVPFTVGPTAFIAWRRGDLQTMWKGPFVIEKKQQTKELQGLLAEEGRSGETDDENINSDDSNQLNNIDQDNNDIIMSNNNLNINNENR